MPTQSLITARTTGAFDEARFQREEKYRQEIAEGARSPSGAKYLKKLNGKHRACIELHMSGVTQKDIAAQLGVSQPWVSTIINDPLSQEVIKQRFVAMDQELRALGTAAVDALRSALASEDMMVRLSAADKWLKAHGYYEKNKTSGALSAEDIVAELMKQTQTGETSSVTIQVHKGAANLDHLPTKDTPFAAPKPVIDHDPLEEFA